MQIVPQDEGGDLGGRVAFLLVDEGEQVEGVGEHVPAADGGIDQPDFLGFGDFEEVVRRAAGGILFALNVIGHVLAQPGVGAIEEPEPAEGVFDEIAHDPVRGEELGDGGDVFRGHGALAGHDSVFFLSDVELVEPTDDLDRFAIFRIDVVDEFADERIRVEQIVGKEQFGLVVNRLEEEWHRLVEGVALSRKQQPVQLGFFVAIEFEVDHCFALQSR